MFRYSKRRQTVPPREPNMPKAKEETRHAPNKRCKTARPRSPVSQDIFHSSWAFRDALCASRRRRTRTLIVTTSDETRRLFKEVDMDGNCGFQAVAKGLKALGILRKSEATHMVVRERLMHHVKDETVFYAQKLASWRQMEDRTISEDEAWDMGLESVEKFLESVMQGGIQGHWLGSMWGGIELMAVARAFDVHIEVFTYCTLKHEVKKYEEHNTESAGVVSLFFAGCASGGHFDLLLPDRPLMERFVKWSSRVGNGMATKCRPVACSVGRLVSATSGLIVTGGR